MNLLFLWLYNVQVLCEGRTWNFYLQCGWNLIFKGLEGKFTNKISYALVYCNNVCVFSDYHFTFEIPWTQHLSLIFARREHFNHKKYSEIFRQFIFYQYIRKIRRNLCAHSQANTGTNTNAVLGRQFGGICQSLPTLLSCDKSCEYVICAP
jgi:hypothetical protein